MQVFNGSPVLIFHGNLSICELWFTLSSCYGSVDIQSSFPNSICVRQPANLGFTYKETVNQCGYIYVCSVKLKTGLDNCKKCR